MSYSHHQHYDILKEEDSELQEQEQRSYLDYYGADLSHTPKWRIIEMLRTVQQLYEQLSNEANGGATRASSVMTASNNNQLQVNFVLPSGVSVDLSTAEGIAALIEELSGSEDGVLRIANFVQEEDYRPAIALGQTAEATLKITKVSVEDEEEYESGARRNLHVEAIRTLLLIGEHKPDTFLRLAQAGAFQQWVIPNLNATDDPELLFYVLTFLYKCCSQEQLLAPHIKDQLTDDVIEQLLNLILLDDPCMDKNAHAALHNASMLALYTTADFEENRVLYKLSTYQSDEVGALGQQFIIAFNREVKELLTPLGKLIKDIFTNPTTAKEFFWVNDLNVLIEIIMREVTDTSDQKLALLYLETLHYLLLNSEYSQWPHKKEQLTAFLLALITVEDDQTLGPIAQKASQIYNDWTSQ